MSVDSLWRDLLRALLMWNLSVIIAASFILIASCGGCGRMCCARLVEDRRCLQNTFGVSNASFLGMLPSHLYSLHCAFHLMRGTSMKWRSWQYWQSTKCWWITVSDVFTVMTSNFQRWNVFAAYFRNLSDWNRCIKCVCSGHNCSRVVKHDILNEKIANRNSCYGKVWGLCTSRWLHFIHILKYYII